MASSIRLRTKTRDGITTVRAIIRHPMETGFRVDAESGKHFPAHYIKQLTVKHNGQEILSCDWTRAVSKNPYLSFMFKDSKVGDDLELYWVDNKGESDKVKTLVE